MDHDHTPRADVVWSVAVPSVWLYGPEGDIYPSMDDRWFLLNFMEDGTVMWKPVPLTSS